MIKTQNINFKKLFIAVLALAFALPLFTSNNVFAEETCTGPKNRQELNTALMFGNATTIKLCGNIIVTGNSTALDVGRSVTIDLNGFTVSGNPSIRVNGKNTVLTIVGEGAVNGRFSSQLKKQNLSLKGGTYTTADPSNYLAEGYSSYAVNGNKVVAEEGLEVYNVNGTDVLDKPGLAVYGEAGSEVLEPELTEDIFKDFILVYPVKNGDSITLPGLSLKEGQTTGVVFKADEDSENIFEISENGEVTTVGVGKAGVTIYPTYNENLTLNVMISVFEVVPADEENEADKTSAEVVSDVIDNLYDEEGNYSETAQTALGDEYTETSAGLFAATEQGGEITVGTEAGQIAPDDSLKEMVENLLDEEGIDFDEIKYYDAAIIISANDDFIGNLHDLGEGNEIKVFISETEDPEEGYEREFFVVRVHDNEPELLEEGVDYEIKDGKFYVISSKFSVFALAFLDKLIPVEEPEEPVEEPEVEEEVEEKKEETKKSSYEIKPVVKKTVKKAAKETKTPNTGSIEKTAASTATTNSSILLVTVASLSLSGIYFLKKRLALKK